MTTGTGMMLLVRRPVGPETTPATRTTTSVADDATEKSKPEEEDEEQEEDSDYYCLVEKKHFILCNTTNHNSQSHDESMSAVDPTTLQREREALSFNPFGDDEPVPVAALLGAPGEQQHDRTTTADQGDGEDDEEQHGIKSLTKELAHLNIPSPASILGHRGSSNESSAASGRTNPLFDALHVLDQDPTPQPPSKGDGHIASTTIHSKIPYSPTAPSFVSSSSLSGSSSPLLDKHQQQQQRSPSISISMGSGSGSGSAAPRRHRLSSASSVKSTRSRRSTSSSLASSLNSSRMVYNPAGATNDPDAHISEVLEGASSQEGGLPTIAPPGGPSPGAGSVTAVTTNLGSGSTSVGGEMPSIRPVLQQSFSQDSATSLQPSVMSLETTAHSPPPVAGYRVPATGSLRMSTFPQLSMCGPAFRDKNDQPIYVCSAILGTAIHPAKAGPHLAPPARMTFAGKEILHEGRFDLLPITPEMKWYDATAGDIPEGKVPIQGGYEESGEQLYHALTRIDGFWVPGKTGKHLRGANFPYAGREVRLAHGYKVLCWSSRVFPPGHNESASEARAAAALASGEVIPAPLTAKH